MVWIGVEENCENSAFLDSAKWFCVFLFCVFFKNMANPLTELRTQLGISQEEAAMLLGISRGHVSKIEINHVPPRGLSEVYLFQAQRLVDQMEEPVIPEPTETGIPAFAEKEMERLRSRKLNLEKEKSKLTERQKTVLRLKAFIPMLMATENFESRRLDVLIARFQRNIDMENNSYGPEVLNELNAELAYIEAQIQHLTNIV